MLLLGFFSAFWLVVFWFGFLCVCLCVGLFVFWGEQVLNPIALLSTELLELY